MEQEESIKEKGGRQMKEKKGEGHLVVDAKC
jgi:hypothetical protein